MDKKFYGIDYSFSSELGDIGGSRYITSYLGDVYEDLEDGEKKIVGKVEVLKLLLELAVSDAFDFEEIFSTENYLEGIGEQIIDFDNEEINPDIQHHYKNQLEDLNICIIKRIEILPEHRNNGLGKRIIKDIYNRFRYGTGLFIVQVFPLQFEATDNDNWKEDMGLGLLEPDYEKAFYQLKAFYQRLGFAHIEGYNELMFLCPIFNNAIDRI